MAKFESKPLSAGIKSLPRDLVENRDTFSKISEHDVVLIAHVPPPLLLVADFFLRAD